MNACHAGILSAVVNRNLAMSEKPSLRTGYLRNLGTAASIFVALYFFYFGASALLGLPKPIISADVRDSDLAALLPGAASFSRLVEREDSPPYREAFDSKGERIALVYYSVDICPEVQGYCWHVPLIAALGQGKLMAVRLLSNWETPAYISMLDKSDYLAQYRDKGASDAFKAGDDVDLVTGATATSRAILSEVRGIVAAATGTETGQAGQGAFPVSALIIAGLFIAAAAAYLLRLRWLRYGVMAASAAYLGFYMKGFVFSSVDIVRMIFFGKGLLGLGAAWLVLVGAIVVSSLLFGRLFCGYLCPFGAVHELCGRLFAGRFKFPGRLAARLKYVKYSVLLAVPALYLISGRLSDAAVEPFSTFFTFSGSFLQWAFLIFVLASGFFVMRFFCRFLCPAGAAMAILSLARIVRDRRRTNCNACGKCIKACPVNALSQGESVVDADYAECLDCNECKAAQKTAPCMKFKRLSQDLTRPREVLR